MTTLYPIDDKNMAKTDDLITSAAVPDLEEQGEYAQKDVQVDVHTHICESRFPGIFESELVVRPR